jgi:hypothetical protein
MERPMPRYEILAHFTCELEGTTAEDAAAQFQRLLTAAGIADEVLQLAVWRQETGTTSPLPTTLRQQLIEFFAALERSADEAETAFRARVEAILANPVPAAKATDRVHADPLSLTTATRDQPPGNRT